MSVVETPQPQQEPSNRFGSVLGQAACMQELFERLRRIAAANVSVLIDGETGTGKGLVAESIHLASARAACPYVVIDCGALATQFAQDELGQRGRGEHADPFSVLRGVFEKANGGSVFFDQLRELPWEYQPKLRRALEKREVRRSGAERASPIDIRVIAATSGSLKTDLARGTFRHDLYFQIAVAQVRVPALRERLDDLPLLVQHFLRQATPPRSLDALPPEVWAAFAGYNWPGNVRELRHTVERLLANPERALDSLPKTRVQVPAPVLDYGPLQSARHAANEEFERNYLEGLFTASGGRLKRAAAIAAVSPRVLQRLLRKHSRSAATKAMDPRSWKP